jgi:hypothetical protein
MTKTITKKHNDFPGELITISVLEREIAYYKTLIRDHDTGHIHTSIRFLQERVNHLKGECGPADF